MAKIKPVSDLRNYNEVLRDITVDEPVYLTKNGRGKYVIADIEDYDRTKATLKLMNELEKGEQSARVHGWKPFEEFDKKMREKLGIEHD
jgi:prevent-host-death family protein